MHQIFNMANADCYVTGETLDVIFQMLDEDELDELFQEEMNVVEEEVSEEKLFTCFSL